MAWRWSGCCLAVTDCRGWLWPGNGLTVPRARGLRKTGVISLSYQSQPQDRTGSGQPATVPSIRRSQDLHPLQTWLVSTYTGKRHAIVLHWLGACG